MTDKKRICLYDLCNEVGFIIPCESGVIYTNQTNGLMCSQSELKGVYFPLPVPDKFSGFSADFVPSDEIYSFLDMVFGLDIRYGRATSKDYFKVETNEEAWIKLKVIKWPDNIGGFDSDFVIMTWQNSD